jgi:DNA topoisomerase III
MSKTLVLAEKPSVGKDLARVLGCQNKKNGYFENDRYIVTWALGHLVTLADPEAYNEKFKAWRLEDLPMLPASFKLEVIKGSGKQYSLVKQLMHNGVVNEIVVATDAGREGELVARWILAKAGVKKGLKRLWISSVTDKAIREGFAQLKSGKDYENLYASAEARAEADWVVGINATRALTCKFNAQLSCGRVQTPTVAIIAAREAEINSFKPQPYYGIAAEAEGLRLVWQEKQSGSTRTFNKEKCDQLLVALQGKEARVVEVSKVYKKKSSPQLYNLTELQRDANRLFDFSAKDTLAIMQGLYENHKVLTYPRTDSRYITSDLVETLKDRVRACALGPYRAMTQVVLKNPIAVSKAFVDNNKVSDHHAIIPTEEPASLSALSFREKKIYDLVVRRFLAALYPPFEYEQTTIKAEINGETFIARGKIVLKEGWKAVYTDHLEDDDEEADFEIGSGSDENIHLADQILPTLNKGECIKIKALEQTRGETKPPPRFTEGSLLKAMENPARFMAGEDKKLIASIGKSGGLGTVATRADVIEKLFNSFLIELRGKEIFTTAKGRQLLDLVPADLKSAALTAQWELKLEAIAKGALSKESFVKEMKDYAKVVVGEIKASEKSFKHDNLTGNRCPLCNQYLLEVQGKKGKMLVCPDRECGHRDMVARTTNARCPQCRKKLELRGSGEGQLFVCKCGYREKLSSFEARKKKEGRNVSKKDVSKFLQEQKKDSGKPINTALADALSGLNTDKRK